MEILVTTVFAPVCAEQRAEYQLVIRSLGRLVIQDALERVENKPGEIQPYQVSTSE